MKITCHSKALTEKAQLKEVRRKSLRDFHMTHPSGSGIDAKKSLSVEKITPTITSEGTGEKPGILDVTEDDSTESESESWEKDKESDDDNQEEGEVDVRNNDHKDDEIKSDEDKGMDGFTTQFATTLTDYTVLSITESSPVFTNIPQSSQTFIPPPILTTPTPPLTIDITNLYKHILTASVFRFNNRITALEKEVAKIKKEPLHTQVTSLVDEHLDTRLGETREEFMNFLSESLTARIKEQVKDQLPQILPKEVSNFAPPMIEKLIKNHLKKIFLDKMEKSESYLTAPEHRDCYDGLKKSYALDKDFFFSYDVYSLKCGQKDKDKDEDPFVGSDRGSYGKSVQSEEPVFEVADSDMPHDKEGNMGDNKVEPRKEIASKTSWFKKPTTTQEPMTLTRYWTLKECFKAFQEKLDLENPKGGDYPFDLSKPLPLITHENRQRVPFEFFINNDLKYLQGVVSTMTYTTSTTKSKAFSMIFQALKTWFQTYGVLLKFLMIDMHYEVFHIRENNVIPSMLMQEAYNQEEMYILQSVFWQSLMSRFKEGDDVAEFAIALRMFTRSLVIQKRVKDLQLGVESYQKKINVTKPDTTRPDLKKRHPYTPYKDPQGFIYVDDHKRNRLTRSDELYKFSDGTLTRLLSSVKDITKNINMECLSKRRWSNLEKKRAHFMIKDINKLLKERRMIRSLENSVVVGSSEEGSTQGYPLDSVEVLSYESREALHSQGTRYDSILGKVKMLANSFKKFSIKLVPRSENKKADALKETLPTKRKKTRAVQLKSRWYAVINGVLYKKSFLEPWLRCVEPLQANYVLRDSMKDHATCRWRKDNPFKDWCEKLNIRQHFASVQHPQTNGMVERANRILGEGIKARLDKRSKDWMDEVSYVLWAHRTMIKSSNGDTPFSLTYGTKAVIPAEIGIPTLWTTEIDMVQNDETLKLNLDLLEEKREQAAIREARSKAKMENTITLRFATQALKQ
ncbi:integrase, catalytic region, zinc finger, CCHC-type containing protein [Tanacetum coccineum]